MKEKINAAYFSSLDENKEPYKLNEGQNLIVFCNPNELEAEIKFKEPILLFQENDIAIYHVNESEDKVIGIISGYCATMLVSGPGYRLLSTSDLKLHINNIKSKIKEMRKVESTCEIFVTDKYGNDIDEEEFQRKKLTIFEFAFEIENLIQVKNNHEKAMAIGYYYSKYLEFDFDLKATIDYIKSDNEVGGYHE